MSPMGYYAILFFLGLAGWAVLFGRHLPSLKSMQVEDQRKWLGDLPPFFSFLFRFLNRAVRQPFSQLWSETFHPALLSAGEKLLRRFRILVLKVEGILQRLSDYFRGRRIAIKNGSGNNGKPFDKARGRNSEFWNEVSKFRDELPPPKEPVSQKKPRK